MSTPNELPGRYLLKQWREREGVSQRAAAELFSVTQATISDWEQGRKVPKIDGAFRIAEQTNGAVPVESWRDSANQEPETSPEADTDPDAPVPCDPETARTDHGFDNGRRTKPRFVDDSDPTPDAA